MLELKNISLQFNNRVVLKEMSLTVKEGEKVLLSAPSGAGKSTLLRLIMGFEPLQEGEVIFQGIPLNERSIHYIRSRTNYISQGTELRDMVIAELISEIFNYKHNKGLAYSSDRLNALMTYFEFDESILTKQTSSLSGGERQRLALIIGAMLDRPVWLLDEVTASLDKGLKEKVINYIKDTDKTILAVSHDQLWEESGFFRVVKWGV